MAAAKDVTIQGDVVLRYARQEAVDARARAERAMEIARAERVGELERAERQAEAKLKEAEARLREAELYSYQSWLHTVTLTVRGAEERVENTKEVARMADARVAEMPR